jgi:hypothetical protein
MTQGKAYIIRFSKAKRVFHPEGDGEGERTFYTGEVFIKRVLSGQEDIGLKNTCIWNARP